MIDLDTHPTQYLVKEWEQEHSHFSDYKISQDVVSNKATLILSISSIKNAHKPKSCHKGIFLFDGAECLRYKL